MNKSMIEISDTSLLALLLELHHRRQAEVMQTEKHTGPTNVLPFQRPPDEEDGLDPEDE